MALWVITGFKQVPIVIEKKSRYGSAYHGRERISVLVDPLTSFSNRPLSTIVRAEYSRTGDRQ